MGILDGLFGRGDADTLREELSRQSARADNLARELASCELRSSQFEASLLALQDQNSDLMSRVAELEAQHLEQEALKEKINSLESDLLQAWDAEAAAKSQALHAADELQATKAALATLQRDNESILKLAAELKEENLRLSKEIQDARSRHAQREEQFLDRERRLHEKSQALQKQQAELASRERELNAREKGWRLSVEPELRRFEAYSSLEKRAEQIASGEADLARRASELAAKEQALQQLGITATSIDAKSEALELATIELARRESQLARERVDQQKLSQQIKQKTEEITAREREQAKFQKRIDALEEEEASLLKRKVSLDRKEARYQQDLERKREAIEQEHKDLRALKSEIKRREDAVVEREREVTRVNQSLLAYQRANVTLREQLSATKSSLQDCLQSRARVSAAPGLRMAHRSKDEDADEDDSPLPPVSKPSLALRSNSPLTESGYRVGSSGITDEQERRELLESFLATPLSRLPRVGNAAYMKLWGEANSRIRIRYVAYHIYWNIEFQGAKETMELARDHWVRDLRWLHRTYGSKLPSDEWPTIPKR